MKKTIISIAAAALCASALSIPAFAEDILTDRSVYADDPQSIAQSIESWEIEGKTVSSDPNAIYPLYGVDLYDYARTGNFEIKPFMLIDNDGNETEKQYHVCDAIDENGNFAGIMQLSVGGEKNYSISFAPVELNEIESITFDTAAQRISELLKAKGFSTDCKEIKLITMTEVGYAYYIDNGEQKMLAAAHIDPAIGQTFYDFDSELILIDDEFKAYADRKLAEYEDYRKNVLDNLTPGENPPTGGAGDDAPLTAGGGEDRAPGENPNTGFDNRIAALPTGLALLSAVIIGGVLIAKKRKNEL